MLKDSDGWVEKKVQEEKESWWDGGLWREAVLRETQRSRKKKTDRQTGKAIV